MPVQEIPLLPTPQKFSIVLNNTTYQATVLWRAADMGGWVLDLATGDVGAPIVSGIPLVTGVNLLEQYEYLGIGGSLIVQTDHDVDAVPTFDNLGSTAHLYFVT